VVVATNHPEFCTPETLRAIVAGAGGDALIVDPWNCWGAAEVFASAREVAERARAAEGSAGPVGATRQPPSPPAQ